MKNATDAIRALRESQPVRPPDDPLRSFLSEVVLRDHARLLKLTLRKLHVGERVHDGDLGAQVEGQLCRQDVSWWRRRRVTEGESIYRYIT